MQKWIILRRLPLWDVRLRRSVTGATSHQPARGRCPPRKQGPPPTNSNTSEWPSSRLTERKPTAAYLHSQKRALTIPDPTGLAFSRLPLADQGGGVVEALPAATALRSLGTSLGQRVHTAAIERHASQKESFANGSNRRPEFIANGTLPYRVVRCSLPGCCGEARFCCDSCGRIIGASHCIYCR